jgi:hypothetical protein
MHIFLFLFTSQLHFSENKGVRSTRSQSESLRECYGECESVFNTEESVDYEEELQESLDGNSNSSQGLTISFM